MIKFESNMLVLNNTFSEEDVEQINAFAEYVREQERERIIALLEAERWELPDGIPAGGEVYMPIEEAIVLIKDGPNG